LEIILFFAGAIFVSWLINRLLLKFSKNLGIRNKNDVVIRWSNESKPSLGGISMFITFIMTTVFYAAMHSGETVFDNIQFIGLLLASTLSFGIGLADDAYNTRPFLKLFGQISCGVLLVLTDSTIDLFHIFWLDAMLTVFWVVAIMNSLNMLDNMDGITATVSMFILLSCMVLILFKTEFDFNFWVIILVAEIGAIIGFMFYNINPSRMFMGDAGSQFIGLFVAFFAVEGIWNIPAGEELPSWGGFLLIFAAFAPAFADTLTVVINRLKRGQSPMVGGKDHTTHHLVYKGYSDFKVWKVFFLISFFAFVITTSLGWMLLSKGLYLVTIVGAAFFVIVFFSLYKNTIQGKVKN
jgi:UDP-GlcNAc:undecaprenyl-phosphate GlcNAc-1-phosphate transferase